jgi:hypothetical protein
MRLTNLAFLALVGAVATPPPVGTRARGTGELGVRYRDLEFSGRVSALTVLPSHAVTLETFDPSTDSRAAVRAVAGRLSPLDRRRWKWTAPAKPGLYPIHVVSGDGQDSLTIHAFVLVPYSRLQPQRLNGYQIGRYPGRPPAGFVEVTRANENTLVSPHFRLKQFLCKQAGGYPKYVVLNEQLLQKLEHLLELANAAGYQASTFHVMSGFRTPAYNRALGNVPFSRHTWGAAADIFIDENRDGRMDDLNGDGRTDAGDAAALYALFERSGQVPGMGKYPATEAHGPFVHVDVRGRRARW